MLTACELCVCATYSALTGTSRGVIAMTVTACCPATGAFGACLPQLASASALMTTTEAPARDRRCVVVMRMISIVERLLHEPAMAHDQRLARQRVRRKRREQERHFGDVL